MMKSEYSRVLKNVWIQKPSSSAKKIKVETEAIVRSTVWDLEKEKRNIIEYFRRTNKQQGSLWASDEDSNSYFLPKNPIWDLKAETDFKNRYPDCDSSDWSPNLIYSNVSYGY